MMSGRPNLRAKPQQIVNLSRGAISRMTLAEWQAQCEKKARSEELITKTEESTITENICHKDDAPVVISKPKQRRKRKKVGDSSKTKRFESEEDSFITIQRNEENIKTSKKGNKKNQYKINTRNHCIFCLRKTTNPGNAAPPTKTSDTQDATELLHTVPGADKMSLSSSTLLLTLNRIWQSLQLQSKDSGHQSEDNIKEIFMNLPKMCRFCGGKLSAADRILKEYLKVTGEIEEIVRESKYNGKYSWRVEQFETSLKQELESGLSRATMRFLNVLGNDNDGDQNPWHSNDSDGPVCTPPNFEHHQMMEVYPLDSTSTELNLKVEANDQVVDFQEEDNDDHQSFANQLDNYDHDDSRDDPDYIKSEPDEDSSSFSENEDESCETKMANSDGKTAQQKTPSSSSFLPVIAVATDLSKSSEYVITKKKLKPRSSDPNENITFSISIDPETNQRRYTCLVNSCGLNYKDKYSLKIHQSKPHRHCFCDLCGDRQATSKNLELHKTRVHLKPYFLGYKCELCKKKIPLEEVPEHARTHIGSIGEEYLLRCPNPECVYVCFTTTALHLHTRNSICSKFKEDSKQLEKVTNVCELCGFTGTGRFTKQLELHLHDEHETPTKNFPCPIEGCQQQFTVKQSVFLHLRQHDIRSEFNNQKCDTCQNRIKMEKMAKHLTDVHQIQEIIKCSQCPFLFPSREFLVDHLRVHRFGVMNCDICNDDFHFSSHIKLREHYFQEHKIGTEHPCAECERVFLDRCSLVSHKRDCHRNNSNSKVKVQRAFQCDECEEQIVFRTRYSLRSHKIKFHGAKPYSCRFCSEVFTNNTLFLRHMSLEHKRGTGRLKAEFKCQVDGCGKVFNEKKSLTRHHYATHLGERPHVCELCGKSYIDVSALQAHTNINHLGLRPYVCEICGESFGSGMHLKRHSRIHTGERPFACEICGQRFRQKEVLKRHLEAHERRGQDFKPNGPMKNIRKRVKRKNL